MARPTTGLARRNQLERQRNRKADERVNGLPLFPCSVVAITLTLLIPPGPMTAAVLTSGTRNRNAGAMVAVGHGLIELPLIWMCFAVHWLCDLVWLEALSLASYRGSRFLQPRAQRAVLVLCGLTLLFFASVLLWQSGRRLV